MLKQAAFPTRGTIHPPPWLQCWQQSSKAPPTKRSSAWWRLQGCLNDICVNGCLECCSSSGFVVVAVVALFYYYYYFIISLQTVLQPSFCVSRKQRCRAAHPGRKQQGNDGAAGAGGGDKRQGAHTCSLQPPADVCTKEAVVREAISSTPRPRDTQPWHPVGANPSSITGCCVDPWLQESHHQFSREPHVLKSLQQHPHNPMGTTAKNQGARLKYRWFFPLLIPRTGQTNCCLNAAAVPQQHPELKAHHSGCSQSWITRQGMRVVPCRLGMAEQL